MQHVDVNKYIQVGKSARQFRLQSGPPIQLVVYLLPKEFEFTPSRFF